MTATFWTGSSLSFTNGSKTVTVNTGPSLDSVKANSSLTAGNYNEPVEVKSVSGNTITLYNNWPGSTGTTSATIKPSAAAAASAGVAAQQLITDIQSLVSSASVTATANSFVKRDSNGRIKAATPSANDDVVTKGFVGTAATKDVGTSAGNVMEVGAFGLGASVTREATDWNSALKAGFWRSTSGGGQVNSPDDSQAGWYGFVAGLNDNNIHQQVTLPSSSKSRTYMRTMQSGIWSPWVELYHSGNTNFNEFGGGSAGSVLMEGYARSSTQLVVTLPLVSTQSPTGISVSGNFDVKDMSSGATGNENVSVAGAFSSGLSSSRNAVLIINLTTSVAAEKMYRLSLATNGAKITVNF